MSVVDPAAKLGRAISPQAVEPGVSVSFGSVEAVNADGTLDVAVRGGMLEGVRAAGDAATATVGDCITVATAGRLSVANGIIGGFVSKQELDELEALLGISSGGGCSMTDLMWDMANPVGSVRQFCTDFDPNDVRGEWKRIKGRFLLASSSSYEAGSAGGEAEHTLTVSEMPSHMHDPGNIYLYAHDNSGGNSAAGHRSVWTNTADKSYTVMNKTASTGGSQPHNNMPPYLAVNTWRRVA